MIALHKKNNVCNIILLAYLCIVAILHLYFIHDYVGWFADDWATYRKVAAYLQDWKQAFLYRANILQLYFFVISPIANLIATLEPFNPSRYLSLNYEDTQLYLSLVFISLIINLLFIYSVYYLYKSIFKNPVFALFAAIFVSFTESFSLWILQPETRYIGFIFVNIATAYLIRLRFQIPSPKLQIVLSALFVVGFNLHYTVIYLIVPIALLFVYTNKLYSMNGIKRCIYFLIFPFLYYISLEVGSLLAGISPIHGVLMRTLYSGAIEHKLEFMDFGIYLSNTKDYFKYFFRSFGPFYSVLLTLSIGFVLINKLIKVNIKNHDILKLVAILVVLSLLFSGPLSTNHVFFRKSIPAQYLSVILIFGLIQSAYNTRSFIFSYKKSFSSFYIAFTSIILLIAGLNSLSNSINYTAANYDFGKKLNQFYSINNEGNCYWTPRLDYLIPYSILNGPCRNLVTEFPLKQINEYPNMYYLLSNTRPLLSANRPWSTAAVDNEHAKWIGFSIIDDPIMSMGNVYSVEAIKEFASKISTTTLRNMIVYVNKRVVEADDYNDFDTNIQLNTPLTIEKLNKGDNLRVVLEFNKPTNLNNLQLLVGNYTPHETRAGRVQFAFYNKSGDLIYNTQSIGNAGKILLTSDVNVNNVTKVIVTLDELERYTYIYRGLVFKIYGIFTSDSTISNSSLRFNKIGLNDYTVVKNLKHLYSSMNADVMKHGFQSLPYKFPYTAYSVGAPVYSVLCNGLPADVFRPYISSSDYFYLASENEKCYVTTAGKHKSNVIQNYSKRSIYKSSL